MKKYFILISFLGLACSTNEKGEIQSNEQKVRDVETIIANYYAAMVKMYSGVPLDSDSLINVYFDKDVYYVTYWGNTEPIDSTKSRLRRALPKVREYQNRVESMNVKIYNDVALAFFILRQQYVLDGQLMDEYLPTTYILEYKNGRWVVVHAHRSADLQTIQQLMQAAQRQQASIKSR